MTKNKEAQRVAADEELHSRLPEYGRLAIANLTDEDLKTLSSNVNREVQLRVQARNLVKQGEALGLIKTEVTIHGPNLRDQSKGQFRIHAVDCSDNAKEIRNNGSEGPWTVKASCKRDVVEDVYGDHLAEQDPPQEHAEPGDQFFTDLYFAPCCADLPDLPVEASAK